MSQDSISKENTDDSSLQQDTTTQYSSEPDWFLQFLINQTNIFGLETGITLYVGGLVISGITISGKNYFDKFAENYKSGFNKDWESLAEIIEGRIREESENYPLFWTQIDSENPSKEIKTTPLKDVAYIHLRDVVILNQNGNKMVMANTMWRGRLESIDGFSLGNLSDS